MKTTHLPYPIPMVDPQDRASTDQPAAGGKPVGSRLRQILDEKPEARPRLGNAIAALLGTGLVTLVALGGLLIWHIRRRARLVRERLNPPRISSTAGLARTRGRSIIMNVNASFRPHERLKDPKDFRRAFDRRRSSADDILVIYGVENGCEHARLGISLLRKKVRAAHARNRLKCLVREAFRLSKSELPTGIDLIVRRAGKT